MKNPFDSAKEKHSTKKKREEEALQQKREKLAQLNASRGKNGSDILHPLKEKKEIKALKNEIESFEKKKKNSKNLIGLGVILVALLFVCFIAAKISESPKANHTEPSNNTQLSSFDTNDTNENTPPSINETLSTEELTESSSEQENGSINDFSTSEIGNTKLESEETESSSTSSTYEVGKEIIFGNYKNEPVKWRILAKNNEKVLIITKELVHYMQFRDEAFATGCTWKNSSIRDWLRNTFYTEAFNINEKNAIVTTSTFDPWPTEEYVEDTLFLLSWEQVKEYFTSQDDRIAFFADYVYNELDSSHREFNGWWLIDSYTSILYKESILRDGKHHDGPRTNEKEGVRPAVWIDTSMLP